MADHHVCPAHSAATPAHPEVLVPQRIEAAGLDLDYEEAVEPGLMAQIKQVCAGCCQTTRCADDFKHENANDRVSAYCPNTPLIDALILERVLGWNASARPGEADQASAPAA